MSDDIVNIEVDGKPVAAKKGQMLIEATDAIGAYIPRFCYHEKLSVAANCRMCLVEVEKAPKPMPACATPVGEGMKVFTKSPKAIAAQKATMEFLLINHPLDCPICDQGGECELQDLALGYGRDVSRYNERKRVVKDKDLGPLVSTDMTRCIHCTRCVRFSEEIEGLQELGTIGRAEDMKISMYIEKSVDHELSANIIDLCPVGALNNKPYRYSARAWEMTQLPTVSPHDCVGSNMYAHVLRGTVKRIVPRENEAINETWIADRDRFSYEGIYSSERLLKPRIRDDGGWRDISWEDALQVLAERLEAADPGNAGMLVSPGSTLEEMHLLTRLAEHLGVDNIDHRITRRDFTTQDQDPAVPLLGVSIADIESRDCILVAGSNLRNEVPMIAHRVRKAALAGAKVSFANRDRYDYHFAIDQYDHGDGLVAQLAGIAVAAIGASDVAENIAELCEGVTPNEQQSGIAASLKAAENPLLLLGLVAYRHAAYSAVMALANAIAKATGARLGHLSEGGNSTGAHIVGVLPHRGPGGNKKSKHGKHAAEILNEALGVTLLFGCEPGTDICNDADAVAKLASQTFVAAFTPFTSDAFEEAADLLLPIGTFAETAGTFVNCEGRWQSFSGIATPVGEARPGWKVLRVLGNLLSAKDFDYQTSNDVLQEIDTVELNAQGDEYDSRAAIAAVNGADAAGKQKDIPIYSVDGLVRRSTALQLTPEARRAGKNS